MNIAEKLKFIIEGATGLQAIYGNNNEINRAVSYGSLPCAIIRLIDTSTLVQENGTITERAKVFFAIIDLVQDETPSFANETIIDNCKQKVYEVVKSLYNNDLLKFVSVANASRIYEQLDDIVTGYGIDLTIENYPDGCIEPKEPLQDKNAEPKLFEQVIFADSGYIGLKSVSISAVTADIDANIKPENIKKDVQILGTIGTLSVKDEQEKTATARTEVVEVLPDKNKTLSKVTINAVTADIDANIVPENIKKDVQILGTIGTFEGEQKKEFTKSFSFNWYGYDENEFGAPHTELTMCVAQEGATTALTQLARGAKIYNLDLSNWQVNEGASYSYMLYSFWENGTPAKKINVDFSGIRIIPGKGTWTGFASRMFAGLKTNLIDPNTDIVVNFSNFDFSFWQAQKGNKTTLWALGSYATQAKFYRLILSKKWDNSFAIPSSDQPMTRAHYREMFETLPVVTDGQVCNIGSANVAKLTSEDIAYIVSKGWTLA